VFCSNNYLYCLPELKYIKHIDFDFNVIQKTLKKVNNDKGLSYNINILNNFRFLYYSLKFKSQFKKWLWEKVREPEIMKQFHPDHLNELKESDDLEEFLDGWINST
jgi:hypothetical protein